MRILTLVSSMLLAGILGQGINATVVVHPSSLQSPAPESATLAEARKLSSDSVKLYNEGKYKEALIPAKRVLEIREQIFPAADRRVIDAIGNVAAIYVALDNLKEAEKFYERLLAADEKLTGPETLRLAKTLHVLAWLRQARGNLGQAEAAYLRALAIKEKVAGPQRVEVAQTLSKLAELYLLQGKFKKAQPLYERLIDFDKKVPPDSDAIASEALEGYLCLLKKTKQAGKADEIEKRRQGGPPPHPNAAISDGVLNGMALTLVRPAYPREARLAGATGVVAVRRSRRKGNDR